MPLDTIYFLPLPISLNLPKVCIQWKKKNFFLGGSSLYFYVEMVLSNLKKKRKYSYINYIDYVECLCYEENPIKYKVIIKES